MSSNTEVVRAEAGNRTSREPLVDRFLRLLSSVRFGLAMLALLVLSCFLGMAIMQANVQGFETYYATLTNSEKLVYTSLGLFNVYGTWWFQTLLALTSLCIILASIDHFPGAWKYVTRPKTVAAVPYIKRQLVVETFPLAGASQEEIGERIAASLRRRGLRGVVTRKGDLVHVFAQRGATNRLGPYVIHVALLLIFAGGFVTSRFGQNGQMALTQGETADSFTELVQELDGRKGITHPVPFTVTADRIEQRLIDPAGGLESSNTLDWITRATIHDGGVDKQVVIHLNEPYDYRGYRFFQSGFAGGGDASDITLAVSDGSGAERKVVLAKGVPVDVDGVGTLTFTNFIGDFDPKTFGAASEGYDNPTAFVRVQTPNGADTQIPAFNRDVANARGGAPRMANGMSLVLDAYAKSNSRHFLSVQKDPGATMFYAGGILIAFALAFTFFVPHRRVWAVVGPLESGEARVTMGGNANRMKQPFQEQFGRWTRAIVDPSSEYARTEPDIEVDDE